MSAPHPGLRFFHARVLSSDYDGTPQLFKVTKVTRGAVYYRADYGQHSDGSEYLGTPWYSTVEKFDSICGPWFEKATVRA